ncbi:MAG: hypothetical protein ACI93T_002352, partial [Porticoccaceae bacterium]
MAQNRSDSHFQSSFSRSGSAKAASHAGRLRQNSEFLVRYFAA